MLMPKILIQKDLLKAQYQIKNHLKLLEIHLVKLIIQIFQNLLIHHFVISQQKCSGVSKGKEPPRSLLLQHSAHCLRFADGCIDLLAVCKGLHRSLFPKMKWSNFHEIRNQMLGFFTYDLYAVRSLSKSSSLLFLFE